MNGEDWVRQWGDECKKSDVCINFLSATYVQSKSCALEWNYSFKEQEKNGKKILMSLWVVVLEEKQLTIFHSKVTAPLLK